MLSIAGCFSRRPSHKSGRRVRSKTLLIAVVRDEIFICISEQAGSVMLQPPVSSAQGSILRPEYSPVRGATSAPANSAITNANVAMRKHIDIFTTVRPVLSPTRVQVELQQNPRLGLNCRPPRRCLCSLLGRQKMRQARAAALTCGWPLGLRRLAVVSRTWW
jgi:hypothetical protein